MVAAGSLAAKDNLGLSSLGHPDKSRLRPYNESTCSSVVWKVDTSFLDGLLMTLVIV